MHCPEEKPVKLLDVKSCFGLGWVRLGWVGLDRVGLG